MGGTPIFPLHRMRVTPIYRGRAVVAPDQGEPEMETYAVLCRVSGGFTGTREAWLKRNDEIVFFGTLGEAEAEAARLSAAMNGNSHRIASFSYSAQEYWG
jgi:uncharacterized protein CbrC (UPF0167 family)